MYYAKNFDCMSRGDLTLLLLSKVVKLTEVRETCLVLLNKMYTFLQSLNRRMCETTSRIIEMLMI